MQQAHEETLHGGVGLTMAKVRENHWVLRLRKLAKRLIKKCYGCKRFKTTALASPPPRLLPKDRTLGSTPFQVFGVEYAGPLKIRVKQTREGKAYVILYVEVALSNWPFSYVEDDIQMPLIRSESMMRPV